MKSLALLLFIILSLVIVAIGIHDIDNAWNMRYVKQVCGGEWVDCANVEGHCMTPEKEYILGFNMVCIGSILLITSSFLAGKYLRSGK